MNFILKIISRVNAYLVNSQRFRKLKNSPGRKLKLGHLDSLELLELIQGEGEIKVIYDIGANIGTWTILAKSIFPHATVYAFEPLLNHLNAFNENVKGLEAIKVYPFALGSKREVLKINVNSFSDASSILNATELLNKEFKISKVDDIAIQVEVLDEIILNDSSFRQADLIKLDIQGYELEALKGCINILKNVKFVIMEVSFIEYYQGQPLFEEVIVFMHANNFKVKAFGENTPKGKKLKQIDILFSNVNQ